jgi:glycogen debranching enzyme
VNRKKIHKLRLPASKTYGGKLPRDRLPEPILEEHPRWIKLYWQALEIGWHNIKRVANDKIPPHMTCMPGTPIIWQWDSCFMALFCRFLNGVFPGMNNLDMLYRHQRSDGFIAMAYNYEKGEPAFRELVNPPLYAWTEWEQFVATGDNARLNNVFPNLIRYFAWMKKNRRRDNGLYWFELPGASGMDNSPRGGSFDRHGSDLCHVDLTAQQALAAIYLARIADVLNDPHAATRFKQEFNDLKTLINRHFWNERAGFFYHVFNDSPSYLHNNWLGHKTIAGFWPLLAEVTDRPEQVSRLVEHLLDQREFGRQHMVPTLSADDLNYDPLGGYWLGGVWPPTNYMVMRGLEAIGRHDTAYEIVANHLENMAKVYDEYAPHAIWECYSPDYPRPATAKWGNRCRPNFVGWGGLGPIAMLIEGVLGIKPDVPAHTIIWRIQCVERHGLHNLRFGSGKVDLLCHKRRKMSDPVQLEIRATHSFILRLDWCTRGEDIVQVKPGRHRFKFQARI